MLQLKFPTEYLRSRCRGLGGGNIARMLQQDRQPRVREDIVRLLRDSLLGQRKRLIQPPCIFERAQQGMSCRIVRGIDLKRTPQVRDRRLRIACCHRIQCSVEARIRLRTACRG